MVIDHQVERADERRLDAGVRRDDARRELREEVRRELGQAVDGDVVEQHAEGEHADADRAEQQRPERELGEPLPARGARDHAVLSRRAGGDLRAGHSYTWRYLRTNRIEIALSASVITNSVKPTTKIVSNSIEPVGMSPREVAAMNAAIDW